MTNQALNETKPAMARDIFAYQHTDRDIVGDVWTKYHTGATVGMVGAFVVFLSGAFITVFEYFSGEKSHTLWLFLIMFALFALGAHCLDKISEMKREQKNTSHENEERNL